MNVRVNIETDIMMRYKGDQRGHHYGYHNLPSPMVGNEDRGQSNISIGQSNVNMGASQILPVMESTVT